MAEWGCVMPHTMDWLEFPIRLCGKQLARIAHVHELLSFGWVLHGELYASRTDKEIGSDPCRVAQCSGGRAEIGSLGPRTY